MHCREIDVLIALEDRPVAWVDLDARIAGINHTRADRTPVDHQRDGVDDTRIGGTFLAQGNHGMLDGDEVAVAKVAGGAVAAGAPLVVCVELDKTVPAIANQRQRQQAHFGLELTLDIGDDRSALLVIEHGGLNNNRRRRNAGGGGRRGLLSFAQEIHFCAQGRQFLLWVDAGTRPEVTSEANKQHGKRCGDYRDCHSTIRHRSHSNFGS